MKHAANDQVMNHPGWVAQLLGALSAHLKVVGSIPGQGTCVGLGFDPSWAVCRRELINVSFSHQCFSLSLSLLPPSFSLSLTFP